MDIVPLAPSPIAAALLAQLLRDFASQSGSINSRHLDLASLHALGIGHANVQAPVSLPRRIAIFYDEVDRRGVQIA